MYSIGDVIAVDTTIAVVVGVNDSSLQLVTHEGKTVEVENKEYITISTARQLLQEMEGAICALAK